MRKTILEELKNTMWSSSIIPLQDGSVLYQSLALKPFPRFEIIGEKNVCSHAVYKLLRSEDVFAVIWRGKIRPCLLKALLRYDLEDAALALTLAQSNPYRFIDWTGWCPALVKLLLHWSRYGINSWKLSTAELLELFNGRWQELLAAADLPPTKAFLRLLSKIPFEDSSLENITLLKQAYSFPAKAKLASHLKFINGSVIDALQLPERYLSVDIMERVALEPLPPEIESVRQLCLDIVDCRITCMMESDWPFRGESVSLAHLAKYLERLQRKILFLSTNRAFVISPPPLGAVYDDGFEAHPLTSVGAIFTEANVMQNCLHCYAKQIAAGRYCAYKVLRPERATLLLVKNCDLWVPAQIRAVRNEFVSPETIEAVESWLGSKFTQMEEDNDAPF